MTGSTSSSHCTCNKQCSPEGACATAVISHNRDPFHQRDYEGRLLECPTPGKAAQRFLFMHNGRALHSLPLEDVPIQVRVCAPVCACMRMQGTREQ